MQPLETAGAVSCVNQVREGWMGPGNEVTCAGADPEVEEGGGRDTDID